MIFRFPLQLGPSLSRCLSPFNQAEGASMLLIGPGVGGNGEGASTTGWLLGCPRKLVNG